MIHNKIIKQKQTIVLLITISLILIACNFNLNKSESIILKDIVWDDESPASMTELKIPTNNYLIQGFIYKANGKQKHPTLLLLHGYPGNERNLDIAQIARANGWNVVYFNYRGSWGNQGQFSFKNCVEDVVNVVDFCKQYQDSLQIDPTNIALFGHSMGAWVCLKALQKLPDVKKGFALSTWNIFNTLEDYNDTSALEKLEDEYFVLNTPTKDIYKPIFNDPAYYNLVNDGIALANKQIIMLDEDHSNKNLADVLKKSNQSFFDYQVWPTDHSFTNKRASLMKIVLDFLNSTHNF